MDRQLIGKSIAFDKNFGLDPRLSRPTNLIKAMQARAEGDNKMFLSDLLCGKSLESVEVGEKCLTLIFSDSISLTITTEQEVLDIAIEKKESCKISI